MAIRLLICQLVFVLVLAHASSSILDDTSSVSGTIEDTAEIEDETPDKNSGLDDIDDSDLPEEEFDEMTSLDEIDDEGLPGELMPESDPQSRTQVKSLILLWAKHLEETSCRRNTSPLQARRAKKPALRLYYQAYQHGKKSSVNDKEWKETLKSEQCSACVLNLLCRYIWKQGFLGIRGRSW